MTQMIKRSTAIVPYRLRCDKKQFFIVGRTESNYQQLGCKILNSDSLFKHLYIRKATNSHEYLYPFDKFCQANAYPDIDVGCTRAEFSSSPRRNQTSAVACLERCRRCF